MFGDETSIQQPDADVEHKNWSGQLKSSHTWPRPFRIKPRRFFKSNKKQKATSESGLFAYKLENWGVDT